MPETGQGAYQHQQPPDSQSKAAGQKEGLFPIIRCSLFYPLIIVGNLSEDAKDSSRDEEEEERSRSSFYV